MNATTIGIILAVPSFVLAIMELNRRLSKRRRRIDVDPNEYGPLDDAQIELRRQAANRVEPTRTGERLAFADRVELWAHTKVEGWIRAR